LDHYVDPKSKSRTGGIFSPENFIAKNRVDQLRLGTEPIINRAYVTSKEINYKNEVDIIKKVKHMKTTDTSGVQRLLRHLRKAKLEQIQLTGGVFQVEQEEKTENREHAGFKFGVKTKAAKSQRLQWGRNPESRKSITAGIGIPVGSRYGNFENEEMKLTFGDQVTRKSRENVVSPVDQKRPPVGQYRPQHTQVHKRPRSQGFGKSKPRITQINDT
jgi:hypothetical protein